MRPGRTVVGYLEIQEGAIRGLMSRSCGRALLVPPPSRPPRGSHPWDRVRGMMRNPRPWWLWRQVGQEAVAGEPLPRRAPARISRSSFDGAAQGRAGGGAAPPGWRRRRARRSRRLHLPAFGALECPPKGEKARWRDLLRADIGRAGGVSLGCPYHRAAEALGHRRAGAASAPRGPSVRTASGLGTSVSSIGRYEDGH